MSASSVVLFGLGGFLLLVGVSRMKDGIDLVGLQDTRRVRLEYVCAYVGLMCLGAAIIVAAAR